MTVSLAFRVARYVAVISVMALIWLVLGMVYLDRYVEPFNKLTPLLMPWKEPASIPAAATVEQRLSIMQNQLDASNRAAEYAMIVMVFSFGFLCIYLTLVYQQKQRRARENRLLLLKNEEIARRNEFIHEFKNNLGRIKRRIDLLPSLPPDARGRIDDNLGKLFADIDIFKKISDERESGLVDFERVNLREMLVGLVAQYGDLADFTFRDVMSPPPIFASQALLKTVFENLIDNSIKYKKPGQPKAKIILSSALDVDGKRRYATISFRDEGKGMDEQEADQCFYKGRGSHEGWGQGLYFVKYVIGLHAGKIRVGKEYTAPDVGTEIIVNLPFVEEAINV
jgi:signal transduction histidine kinase